MRFFHAVIRIIARCFIQLLSSFPTSPSSAPGCLADLVRCTVVCKSLQHLHRLFNEIRVVSVVAADNADLGECAGCGCAPGGRKQRARAGVFDDEERGAGDARWSADAGEVGDEEGSWMEERALFRMTACKNRFRAGSPHLDEKTLFRNMSLNLEVGWVFQGDGSCELVPVSRWKSEGADTLICGVQIHLHLFYYRLEPHIASGAAKAGARVAPEEEGEGEEGRRRVRRESNTNSFTQGSYAGATSQAHSHYIMYRDLHAA